MLNDPAAAGGASLADARVLVTGAAGFIGSNLCKRLLALGANVHATSRSFEDGDQGRLHLRKVDLSNNASARRLLADVRPDLLLHFAGLAVGARDASLVLPTLESNLVLTVNVLCAALDAGSPRIVLAGSLEEPTEPQAVPSSPYAMSKWAASSYGRMFGVLYGLPIAIARIFMTYGPTSRDLDKLVPHVSLSLLNGRSPKLASGTREVDWIYIDDVVEGVIALATSPLAVGQTLDIGSGILVSIRSLVERLTVLVGSSAAPEFGARPDRHLEQVRVADVQRTFAACGWKPRVSLDDGLARTLEWFRRHRSTLRPL